MQLIGKTPWEVGPVVRYDAFDGEEFRRLTTGVWWGAPKNKYRMIGQYEIFEAEAGRHDDRFLLQSQVVC